MPLPVAFVWQTPEAEQARSESRAQFVHQRAAHVDLPPAARPVRRLALLVPRARQRMRPARARQRVDEEHLLRAQSLHPVRVRGDEQRVPASGASLDPPPCRPRPRRLFVNFFPLYISLFLIDSSHL